MAQEIDNKLEQLKALLVEVGESEQYNMFVVIEDKKQEKIFSGLCGTIRDIKAALCYAFDSDIAGFTVAVHSILTYAIAHDTLEKDGVLFNDIKALMYKTREARKKEIQEDENNG